MVKCPFCAEQVQPDARLCRYCGRRLPEGADAVEYIGQRWGAGRTVDGKYGLWNLAAGGPPTESYEEWPTAWRRYQALESSSSRVSSGKGLPPGTAGPALLGIGGLLLLVGSFLPWLTAVAPFVGSVNRSGLEGGDGIFTLVAGIVTLAMAVLSFTGTLGYEPVAILGGIAAAVGGVVGAIDLSDVQHRVGDIRAASRLVSASTGGGLWAVMVGAIVAVVGAIMVWQRGRNLSAGKHVAA